MGASENRSIPERTGKYSAQNRPADGGLAAQDGQPVPGGIAVGPLRPGGVGPPASACSD